MMNKPESLNILGITYRIIYFDSPVEVDLLKRESLWGLVDYWDRTIRIYDNGRKPEDIWEVILHEVLHAIGNQLKLQILDCGDDKDEHKHDELDILAMALFDTLSRNNLLKV